MLNVDKQMQAVTRALCTLRVPAAPAEYDLHKMVAAALDAAGIEARHEAPLGPRCRVDFLAGSVGIEVKRGAPPRRRLMEQAARYLKSDALSALIVVTTRGVNLPRYIAGKPLVVFGLNRLWGVALP